MLPLFFPLIGFVIGILQSGTSFSDCQYLQLYGAPKKGIFLSLTRQIIFLLPLLLIFPYLFGIDGVMYTAPIADLAAASVSIVMVVREFKIMAELQKAAA